MFENPRRGRQARNFTTNAPKILDLKSSSEQIFSRKLPFGAPDRTTVYTSAREIPTRHRPLTRKRNPSRAELSRKSQGRIKCDVDFWAVFSNCSTLSPEVRSQSNYMYDKINGAGQRSATFRNFFSWLASSNHHESQTERNKGKEKKNLRHPGYWVKLFLFLL